MSKRLTRLELQAKLRTGYSFDPRTPGLKAAARELIRPLVETMKGREIVYVCRDPKLLRVEELKTDADGFCAVAVPLNEPGSRIPTRYEGYALRNNWGGRRPSPAEFRAALDTLPPDTQPFDFGAKWAHLCLHGTAICMNMLTDHFYTDAALVAAVRAAAARGDYGEIRRMLERTPGTP